MLKYCRNLIAENSNAEFAMFLMKINDLDEYERKHGSEAADIFYNDIVKQVQDYVGARGIVCEFEKNCICIVIKGISSELNVRSFVSAMRNSIAWKYQLIDSDYDISFTFGISRFPENGVDLDRVYRKMEAAMERASKKNQNCYVIYKEYLHGELEEKAACS
jgi:GGDEF domain-containing protein